MQYSIKGTLCSYCFDITYVTYVCVFMYMLWFTSLMPGQLKQDTQVYHALSAWGGLYSWLGNKLYVFRG